LQLKEKKDIAIVFQFRVTGFSANQGKLLKNQGKLRKKRNVP
jgi:hypothetical protein